MASLISDNFSFKSTSVILLFTSLFILGTNLAQTTGATPDESSLAPTTGNDDNNQHHDVNDHEQQHAGNSSSNNKQDKENPTKNSRFDLDDFLKDFDDNEKLNENSGVEKGTKTELPSNSTSSSKSGLNEQQTTLKPVDNKLGVVTPPTKSDPKKKTAAEPAGSGVAHSQDGGDHSHKQEHENEQHPEEKRLDEGERSASERDEEKRGVASGASRSAPIAGEEKSTTSKPKSVASSKKPTGSNKTTCSPAPAQPTSAGTGTGTGTGTGASSAPDSSPPSASAADKPTREMDEDEFEQHMRHKSQRQLGKIFEQDNDDINLREKSSSYSGDKPPPASGNLFADDASSTPSTSAPAGKGDTGTGKGKAGKSRDDNIPNNDDDEEDDDDDDDDDDDEDDEDEEEDDDKMNKKGKESKGDKNSRRREKKKALNHKHMKIHHNKASRPNTAYAPAFDLGSRAKKGPLPVNKGENQAQIVDRERAFRQNVNQLAKETKKLEQPSRRNTSIMINGRKFDQVNPVECVDERFYSLLMADLRLIEPDRLEDSYGSYYDFEYAKAVAAIVDTPSLLEKHHRSPPPSSPPAAAGSSTGHSVSSAHENASDSIDGRKQLNEKVNILQEVKRFWRETMKHYKRVDGSLNKSKLPIGQLMMMTSKNAKNHHLHHLRRHHNSSSNGSNQLLQLGDKSNHQVALENYQYLLERLEQLKGMLLEAEEAIIVMNNRVRKLNEIVTEHELQWALCSCIGARSGRAALMLMNELFVDRNSERMLLDLSSAQAKAEAAALDAAQFCSYWYGDTIRSEAIQREKQIRELVLKVKANNLARLKRHKSKRVHKETHVIEHKYRNGRRVRTVREVQTKIVTTIVQMTTLWLPNLANWIKSTLNLPQFTKDSDELAREVSSAIGAAGGMMNSTTQQQRQEMTTTSTSTEETTTMEDSSSYNNNNINRTKRSPTAEQETFFSTPFDNPSNYEDLDPFQQAGSLMNLAKIAYSARKKRSPAARVRPGKTNHHQHQNRPAPTKQRVKESDFEERISRRANHCAVDGFRVLLDIAHEQNSLMYATSTIPLTHPYIVRMRKSFMKSLSKYWRLQRDSWSKNMTQKDHHHDHHQAANDKQHSSSQSNAMTSMANSNRTSSNTGTTQSLNTLGGSVQRTVDEVMDNLFDERASSYERGARLGFTVGKFVGEKAAQQWPDPSELNTFTYDSIFLAGIGHGYSEEDSRLLERRIVAETAKRVAFVASSREAFAKTLHTAYLRAAFVGPVWGILHAQRVVAKEGARQGNKVGFEAASRAGEKFIEKATKFFRTHTHERQLAAPYKLEEALRYNRRSGGGSGGRISEQWNGVMEQIDQVQLESELNRNISRLAKECGQRSGSLMGAMMGLAVAPEAFETYTRFRGSLEALESEFNQFKLGALRAYELGESWAYLNYTAQMNLNLDQMKRQMRRRDSAGGDNNNASDKSSSSSGKINKITIRPSTGTGIGTGKCKGKGKGKICAMDKRRKHHQQNQHHHQQQHHNQQLKHRQELKKVTAPSTVSSSTPTMVSLFQANNDQKQDGMTLASTNVNTNNVFQFMLTNYGSHLVSNHSRTSMLTLRQSSIDDSLLRDLKIESRDLIAKPSEWNKATDTTTTNSHTNNDETAVVNNGDGDDDDDDEHEYEDDELFEMKGKRFSGELSGQFNSLRHNGQTRPIKFNILDLGPQLEFQDGELEHTAREHSKSSTTTTNATATNQQSQPQKPVNWALESTPLTQALARLTKIFLKFSVARRKPNPTGNSQQNPARQLDDVVHYLNANNFDQGDGYLCGTFSQLHKQTSSGASGGGSTILAMEEDDLTLEVGMLDELFERIEQAPPELGSSINLVENLMSTGTTTLAPERSIERRTTTTTTTPKPEMSTKKQKVTLKPSKSKIKSKVGGGAKKREKSRGKKYRLLNNKNPNAMMI